MLECEIGDRVWIDILDGIDPDHGRYHAERGRIVNISEGEVDTLTGGDRDSIIYRMQFSTGEELDLRYQSIRPLIQ